MITAAEIEAVDAPHGGERGEAGCRHSLAAIRRHHGTDGLLIRAIAQLANLEARLGERSDDEPRVLAIERLRALLRIAALQTVMEPPGGRHRGLWAGGRRSVQPEEQARTAPADPSFWSPVAIADALLVRHSLDQRLAADDASGEGTARQVLESHQEVFSRVHGTAPRKGVGAGAACSAGGCGAAPGREPLAATAPGPEKEGGGTAEEALETLC